MLCSLFLLAHSKARAEADSTSSCSWDLDFSIGRTVTYGDLTSGRIGSDGSWSFSAGGVRNFNSLFAIRGDLLYGNLHGNGSEEGSNAKYYFNSRMNFELSVSASFKILQLFRKGDKYRLSIHTQAGVGLLNCSPKVFQRGFDGYANYFVDKDAGTSDRTADYRGKTHPVIPLGAGLKYQMTDRMSVFLNGCYRITFTDEINGYVEKQGVNDGYMIYAFGASFHL
ncbi:MAG: hypothetical protein ACKOA1_04525 [Bacteroidota bacterium]